ncbi:MAG TPA: chloride channel protein [Nitratifractor sp.]|nr:chloride channel protein [Nitratifractor sp.]
MLNKLIIASLVTGLISGAFITIYELLITFTTYFIFMGDPVKTIPTLPVWYIYLLPTVMIFFVNKIITKDPGVREYGVNEIAESITQNRMTITLKTLFLKILASVLSLSSGFLIGTEGPSAGIGAMIAYHIHRLFQLPTMLIKVIISIGASSGIAAIFVSPVTGMAFAVENIAYQFVKQYIGYLIIASMVAFAVSINFLEPIIFHHSNGRVFNNTYLIANLFFIPFITAFIFFYLFLKKRLLHFIDLEIFKNFSRWRNHIFAFIGGSVIGTILLIKPEAAFSGKLIVMTLINEEHHLSIFFIFSIILLRIIGTTISIYANAVGGLFLPLMSIGALIGYAFAELFTHAYIPVEPYYFAAIGAAVFMGVLMKLPLTAVVLAMETTFDYNVVVATGISVVLVSYFSSLYFDIRKKYITRADK